MTASTVRGGTIFRIIPSYTANALNPSSEKPESGEGRTCWMSAVAKGIFLPYQGEFDAVFVRALSLYNVPRLEGTEDVTDALLGYLKRGGVLIFAYPSNQCPLRKSATWIHHSLADTRKCFASYPNAKVYYTIRAVPLPSFLAVLISKMTGIGGELVALIWKRSGSTLAQNTPA